MKTEIQCPLPKLDFEVITMGHGSGGLLTNKLLDAGVFSLFENEFLDERHDGAILEMNGKIAMSTDSFVVSPISFPGGNIGELAINGTVNDLAMCGAIPDYISVGFILEEGLKMEEFWEVLVSMKVAAERAHVKIVTGDTKVVEKGKGDKIFINTTGIGHLHPNANIHPDKIKSGDKIIVSGLLAEHGVAIMSLREGLQFDTTIKSDTRPLNHLVKNLLEEFGQDIHLMRDPTRGGLATVLAEIAKSTGHGISVAEKTLPIDDQVAGACELLGLDPMYVANEGIFVAFVKNDTADEFLQYLKKSELGGQAKTIGEVVDDHKGQAILVNAIGGKRVIHMLPGEQLPRIC